MRKCSPIGFKAKGGSDRVTSGIWLWSEPILTTNKSGEEVAILLMDTQGTFDRKTTSAVNSFIFGFSIAFSSVTMYNVKEDITEQDLDNLATFAHSVQPLVGSFQSLKFIVRDWLDDAKYFHGPEGGRRMISEMFDLDKNGNERKIINEPVITSSINNSLIGENSIEMKEMDGNESDSSMDDQLVETRRVISRLFESITGFLAPPPGDKISRGVKCPIKVKYMEGEFKRSIDQLCQEIFVHDVKIRESDGRVWTAETFSSLFDHMAQEYESGNILDPGTFREALGKKIALAANQFAFHSYMEWIEKEIFAQLENTKQVFVHEEFLTNLDQIYRVKALDAFQAKVSPFGSFEKVQGLLLLNINKWLEEKENSNRETLKRKLLEEENHRLELQMRRLKLQNELKVKLEARTFAAEEKAKKEADEEERIREEEERIREEEEEAERERKIEEEFEFIQSENLARIEGKEKINYQLISD